MAKILQYNAEHNLLFFRISSDFVPFASHPVCKFDWQKRFKKEFALLGEFIKSHGMRISMHPDQFVLINATEENIVERSVAELEYHCKVLDSMGLDESAKIQIHVGGVYGDKKAAIERFAKQYEKLSPQLKKRLCVENDDRLFSVKDCMQVHELTGMPVIFDSFHHQCFNNGEPLKKAMLSASKTWKKKDGILMADYSSQQPEMRKGSHASHIDIDDFNKFISQSKEVSFDLMLEIKDKELSALKAKEILNTQ
jgi:UV DNA damage endonuclease